MPGGGKITLQTANTVLTEEYSSAQFDTKPGNYVYLSVTDTGVGMDEETIQNIFLPFFTTKEQGKGTGLGLSTCYGIIKQNQGSIHVKSSPGEGSTFEIYFPVTEKLPSSSEVSDKQEITPGGAETILIVEDELSVQHMMKRILKDQGYNVLTAVNGTEALRYLERDKHIDMVITDVIMPKMGGWELSEEILKKMPGMPIMFMSGYTEDLTVNDKIAKTNRTFLSKPFTPRELLGRVRKILDAV
jgi:CheY-like chemotaxis protein